MPAGDASRTWFPEMLEALRAKRRADLTFRERIALRDELDAMLHRIRVERHIRPQVVTCRRCGHMGPAAGPDVSVRAMILLLGRFGIAPAELVKALEKCGGAYRMENGIGPHGKIADSAAAEGSGCGH
jgi:hypothetical protein